MQLLGNYSNLLFFCHKISLVTVSGALMALYFAGVDLQLSKE